MTGAQLSSEQWLERLVAFDTTSRNSNLDLIEDVRGYLADHGIEARLVHDETGTKANLFATLGPADKPGVVLSGHTDVVPVDGQDWQTDPFALTAKDGRLYGRGTADMKGFLAVALANVPRFLEARLDVPVHLAMSYDEEVGCIGVHRLIDMLNRAPVRPRMCIVGEPTDMAVVIAHKGKHSMRARVRGLECHSSLAPRGVNAVEFAALAIAHIRAMGERFRSQGPFDPEFDVPYTTAHTGVIAGGTALNIVPRDCAFEFEFRTLPEQDGEALVEEVKAYVRDTLEPQMQAIDPQAGFSWETVSKIIALDSRDDDEAVRFVKAIAGRNDHTKVAFGTEAGAFQRRAQIPAVVCGPGSIDQAHKPNEFVTVEQIRRCEVFVDRLIDRLAAA